MMRFLMFAAPAGGRKPLLALALSVLMLVAPPAAPPVAAQLATFVVIRDAETETLLRNFANPLFRAAGVEPNSVRIILIRDDALNAFVSTGNRLFVNTGIIARSESALEPTLAEGAIVLGTTGAHAPCPAQPAPRPAYQRADELGNVVRKANRESF